MDNLKQAAAELAQLAGLEEEQTEGNKFEWRSDLSTWGQCKELMQKQTEGALKFIAHSRHKLKGKAQLVNQNKQQLTFLTRVKIDSDSTKAIEKVIGIMNASGFTTNQPIPKNYKEIRCLGDSIDKRKEEIDKILSEYVFIYRVISEQKEYTVLSFEELGNEVYTLTGMNIRLNMPTEISKQLSLKGFANVFICKSAEPAIKILPKEDLVALTKKTGLTVTDFLKHNFLHPDGTVYEQPEPYMALRAAQLLSGKFEGYPLHCMTMGPPGTGKSMEAESLDSRFREEQGILEAANSRHKSIVPSFKENPATPGYYLSCVRIAIIDELCKMIEAAAVGTRQEQNLQNLLTQMNMLLEHKKRTIGSGNNNFMKAQATAKGFIVTNPLSFKRTLAEHALLMDITLLSRMLPYCQDAEHLRFLAKRKSGTTLNNIDEKNGTTYKIYIHDKINDIFPKASYTTYSLCCTTNLIDADDYLTVIDSASSFLVAPDFSKIKNLYSTCLNLLPNPTLKQIFAPRGIHHLVLLLDGLVKLRCLFRDYDATFTPIDEDYQVLETIIFSVLSTWTTDFSTLGGIL